MKVITEENFCDWLKELVPDEYKQYVGNDVAYCDKYGDETVKIKIKNCTCKNIKKLIFPSWVVIERIADSKFNNIFIMNNMSVGSVSNVQFNNVHFKNFIVTDNAQELTFVDCSLSDFSEFENVYFKNVMFKNCSLFGTYFSNCDFNGIKIINSSFTEVEMSECTWHVVLGVNDNEISNTLFQSCRFNTWCSDLSDLSYPSVIFAECCFVDAVWRSIAMNNRIQMLSCSIADSDMKRTIGIEFKDNCYFENCDLRYAIVFNNNYTDFDIENHGYYIENEYTVGVNSNVPEEGSFIGFKIVPDRRMVKLRITENAFRVGCGTDRRCKCSEAEVLSIEDMNGYVLDDTSVRSHKKSSFVYEVGKTVHMYDEERFYRGDERIDKIMRKRAISELSYEKFCKTTSGIYFFLTRKECRRYAENMGW